ncbi:MAG: hypothetical protein M1832_002432 [Thelocarpon impressellum]|nr:MAG: hypothetical protein M1832_002432 [Thelocarpon impressellum]
MSAYSSSSQDSYYSTPGPQSYSLVTPGFANNPRSMTQNDKDQLVHSLRTHRVKTLTELRRIEKVFAHFDQAEFCEPMTAAWAHFVNSNNMLSELRGLTKNYPFSSELLDEAKWMVIEDPASIRSWNYCWLVLAKIEAQQLIQKHAKSEARKPAMWGNKKPTAAHVAKLASAFVVEWTRAVAEMLRHWDKAPSTTGR